jgi:iron complex transport system ATP-binding protein
MNRGDSEGEVLICGRLSWTAPDASFVLECDGFRLSAGEVVGLVGLNGSGKTTLLRCLSGDIVADGLDCQSSDDRLYISPSQTAELADDVLVADYYALAHVLHGRGRLPAFSRSGRLRKVLSILQEFAPRERFCEIAWKRVAELSSGEKQRIALADLLLSKQKILLLDEPAAHFDVAFEDKLWRILKERSRKVQGACVVISHNINLLSLHADRIYVARITERSGGRLGTIVEDVIAKGGNGLLEWLSGGHPQNGL